MSIALTGQGRYVSREDYYRWYDAQARGRYERVDGEIVAMASERAAHARMKAAAFLVLRRAVTEMGLPCEVMPDGITVPTGDSDFEPDALVNCGSPMPDTAIAATNPVVVVEILSPGTMSTDTGVKLVGYFAVPSIMHCLIVHPIRRAIIHHRRTPDGISTSIIANGPSSVDLPGITVTLEEIYEAARP